MRNEVYLRQHPTIQACAILECSCKHESALKTLKCTQYNLRHFEWDSICSSKDTSINPDLQTVYPYKLLEHLG